MKWMLVSPEIVYLLAAMGFLMGSFAGRPDPRREHAVSLALSGVGVLFSLIALGAEGHWLAATYRMDLFTQVFKALVAVGLFLVLCLCGEMHDLSEKHRHDFHALLFLCTLALMMLVSSDHLLTLVVSLELSSYSLYVLVALRKDRDMGLEAGLKYFIVGIVASAVMLFGLALLYGLLQAAYVPDLMRRLPEAIGQPAVLFALLLALSGFFFKLAVFPFHHWAPDVYQGAMNQVAAYIATASKVAAIAVLTRLVAASGAGTPYLIHALVVLSIASMTVGNLAAITQQDLKRLLAYSTVAHSGYVLLGVLSMNRDGYAGVVFYALALLIMKFTAFLVVVRVAFEGRNVRMEDLAGLHRRSPLLALALMVSLFSLAGIPPTVGFTGKFLVFVAAMERGYFALVLIAMINVVISLYYYLIVIKAAYLLEPVEARPPILLSLPMRVLTGGLVVAMIGAGFYPSPLIELALAASRALH